MKKIILIFVAAMTGMLCMPQQSSAQVPVPAANPDNAITSGNITDARNVNCDMILHPTGGGQLRIIAYDDYNTNTSYLYIEDYLGVSATVTIPGARDIDVVLGDDMSNPGNDYIAVVVYNNPTTPVIESFSIVGTGMGFLSVSSLGASSLPISSAVPSFQPPHIDMYPDPGAPIFGIPSLHEYAVTWSEYTGPGYDAYLTHGDNANTAIFGTVYNVTSGGTGMWPDVACLWDYGTNEPFAYVAHLTGSGIDLWEANLSTTANSVIAPGLNAGMPVDKSVRIEAMNQYDPGAGLQKYQLAYAANAGSGVADMISYNDLTGNFNLSAAGTGLGVGNNIHPAVSAGPGPLMGGGYGNDNHSVCWYNDGTPFYYSQAIEVNSGMVNGGFPDYYEVNQNPSPFIVLDAYYAPIAVSASSNWGDNNLLTAWNNDNDIYYKFQGDIVQYKPTGVKAIPATAHYRLYPNPAASAITIEGITRASYTITDVTGRILLKGNLTKASSTINIECLSKGMYLASATENGKTTVLKFVKH